MQQFYSESLCRGEVSRVFDLLSMCDPNTGNGFQAMIWAECVIGLNLCGFSLHRQREAESPIEWFS